MRGGGPAVPDPLRSPLAKEVGTWSLGDKMSGAPPSGAAPRIAAFCWFIIVCKAAWLLATRSLWAPSRPAGKIVQNSQCKHEEKKSKHEFWIFPVVYPVSYCSSVSATFQRLQAQNWPNYKKSLKILFSLKIFGWKNVKKIRQIVQLAAAGPFESPKLR